MAAKAVGLSFEDVCERVAALALERADEGASPPAPRRELSRAVIPGVTKSFSRSGRSSSTAAFLLLAVVVGFVLVHQLLFLLIRRIKALVVRGAGIDHPEVKKRADTLASVLKSTSTVFLVGITIFFILEILGVDVRPLVAGAGSWASRSGSARRPWCATA
jgi:hypothetical protein